MTGVMLHFLIYSRQSVVVFDVNTLLYSLIIRITSILLFGETRLNSPHMTLSVALSLVGCNVNQIVMIHKNMEAIILY